MTGQTNRNKILLVGDFSSGKNELLGALLNLYSSQQMHQSEPLQICVKSKACLAMEYYGPFINAPSEFLENRRFYPALISTAADCYRLLFIQSAISKVSLFPPCFASALHGQAIGVVTKCQKDMAIAERAIRFLKTAGIKETHFVDIASGYGLSELYGLLF